MKICISCTQLLIQAFTCVYMLASGCFPVCLAMHITQCIQLPLLMEDVPREKSPQFRVQGQISLWLCYLFGEASWWKDWGGAVVQRRSSKNFDARLIREDVLKGDRWWRGEMQKGHPEGCITDGIGNKCVCCERGWRAEKEINEQVWRATVEKIGGGSGLSFTTPGQGDHSSPWTVCVNVCINAVTITVWSKLTAWGLRAIKRQQCGFVLTYCWRDESTFDQSLWV